MPSKAKNPIGLNAPADSIFAVPVTVSEAELVVRAYEEGVKTGIGSRRPSITPKSKTDALFESIGYAVCAGASILVIVGLAKIGAEALKGKK